MTLKSVSDRSEVKRKLHIGGKTVASDWEIFNALPGPHVDHVGNANDLSRFPDETFDEIYASHVLEHFDYQEELLLTLKEWHRVLKPLGPLYVSVPDLDVLARLILKEGLNWDERFQVMRMMFGGHLNEYDYHLVGLNEEFLESFLRVAGFEEVVKVEGFDIFQDTSTMEFKGQSISLNMIATKGLSAK